MLLNHLIARPFTGNILKSKIHWHNFTELLIINLHLSNVFKYSNCLFIKTVCQIKFKKIHIRFTYFLNVWSKGNLERMLQCSLCSRLKPIDRIKLHKSIVITQFKCIFKRIRLDPTTINWEYVKFKISNL